MTTQTRAPSSNHGTELWLDHLPNDISTRISDFLTPHPPDRGNMNVLKRKCLKTTPPPNLRLAEASETQRIAAVAALSNSLRVHSISTKEFALIERWRAVFRDDIREVHLPSEVHVSEQLRDLLSLPAIQKATLPNRPDFVRSLITGGGVTELHLHLCCNPTTGMDGPNILADLLSSCSVEKLRLTCLGCETFDGIPCFAGKALNGIKRRGQGTYLRSLHVACTKIKPPDVAFLRNLEELRVERVKTTYFKPEPVLIASTQVELLRSLKSVGMVHIGTFAQLVDIGEAMTELSLLEVLSGKDVAKLRTCTKLRRLDIMLAEGAEEGFPKEISSLHSISLTWEQDEVLHGREAYYAPAPNTLSAIVRRNPGLEELRLRKVKVSFAELGEMLRETGRRLRVLDVPIGYQGHYPSTTFSWLILQVLRHNTGLEELGFGIIIEHRWKQPFMHDLTERLCVPENCLICSLGELTEHAASLLSRRLPRLRLEALAWLRENLNPLSGSFSRSLSAGGLFRVP